jgi:hypothetical protein
VSVDPLRQLLRDLRAGRLAQDAARIDDAATQAALKRTAYLKLRHGDPVPAFLEYLPACAACTQVHPPGDFGDYRDFEQCDTRLNEARAAGALLRIGEPVWYKAEAGVLGGEAFFACKQCEAVWKITLPERAQRGGWYRKG